MEGRARAAGAGTVLNALATKHGCAFAIDRYTTAEVVLQPDSPVTGTITDHPAADTTLIEQCLTETLARFGPDPSMGGTVTTSSELPMASGLKSSSAAANATVLATLSALGCADDVDRLDAIRVGVAAAREAGVTVTGAFDDASASMLGGLTMTDNANDELLFRDALDRHVLVYTPPAQALSADADVERCQRLAPVAETIRSLAEAGKYEAAMTINGFAYSAALGFSADRMLEALPHVDGVSLSGTGPSTVAIGSETALDAVAAGWDQAPGSITKTTTTDKGAYII